MADELGGEELALKLGQVLIGQGRMVVTAESCTGGWVAEVLTSIAGSSAWFERGFVTYSNAAKQELLGVSAETLARFGAVSEEIAREMAEGALRRSHADIALAVTGIAGPGGGTPQKPVGMVCFGWSSKDRGVRSATHYFSGDRRIVRGQAVITALQGLLDYIQAGRDGAQDRG